MKRRKTQPDTLHHLTSCEVEGCAAYGEYRAPKQRAIGQYQEYYLFCLEHVREFNKSYNFFNGMDDEAVQAFMKDAVTGHRPTWRLGSDHLLTEADLENSLRGFFSDAPLTHTPASLPATLRKALEVFVLTHPTDKSTIKQSYKKLVKQYHPDVNKNDDAAEKFKEIIDLYYVLIEYYPSS